MRKSWVFAFFLSSILLTTDVFAADTSGGNNNNNDTCSICDTTNAITTGLGIQANPSSSDPTTQPWLFQILTVLGGITTPMSFTNALAVATVLTTIQNNNWSATDAKTSTQNAINLSLSQSVSAQATTTTNVAKLVPSPGQSPGTANANFSIGSLLDNVSLTNTGSSSQVAQAQQMIQFLAAQGNPVQNLPTNLANIAPGTNPKIDVFRASLGSYNAALSVGLNVLYKLLSERTVQTGLGTAAGMKNKSDASPLEVEIYNVMTPFSPDAMAQLPKTGFLDLQRQQILLLAGIQYQMMQNRLQLEQLNATMAAMQLQMLQTVDKKTLDDLRSAAINAQ